MFFKVQLITNSCKSMKTLYRDLSYFSSLGDEIDHESVPKNTSEILSEYIVYWVDEDSHKVIIKTENDFKCMLKKFKSYPTEKENPKIYLEDYSDSKIKYLMTATQIKFFETIAEPKGVCGLWDFVCSSCNIQILGRRLKCLECENYNLCMSCEFRKVYHKDHVMLYFNAPESETYFKNNFLIKKNEGCSKCKEITIDNIDCNQLKTKAKDNSRLNKIFSSKFILMLIFIAILISAFAILLSSAILSRAIVLINDVKTLSDLGSTINDAELFPVLSTLLCGICKAIINGEKITTSSSHAMDICFLEDEKIENAIEEITALGYNNSGNWLYNLLTTTNGDINRALDMLYLGDKQ